MFDALLALVDVGSAEGFLLAALSALAAGLIIAFAYMFRSVYTRGFAVTLALLPVVVQAVICVVNGNLGTGVAVMGAFSLVRFRSAPGSSREITLIFLAMCAGLATGMAYAGYALAATAAVCLLMVALYRLPLGDRLSPLYLRVTIAEDLDYTGVFDDLFDRYTRRHRMEGVKTTNMGSLFELRYTVTLRDPRQEKAFLDELRCRNGNLTVSLTRNAPAHEEL